MLLGFVGITLFLYLHNCLFMFQYVAELTYDMVLPGPSVRIQGHRRRKKYGRKGQPSDLREGFSNAYVVLREVVFLKCKELPSF
jgi:hypothetical protein